MPRRTHPLLLVASLAVGLLLALGLAACGGGGPSASTLDVPPLTVGTNATMPNTGTAATTTTGTTTTSTTDTTSSSGGASSSGGGGATGGGTTGGGTTGGGATGGGTGGGTTGGGATGGGAGGGTGTPTQPSNNGGGASPNYQSFCNQNPGAC